MTWYRRLPRPCPTPRGGPTSPEARLAKAVRKQTLLRLAMAWRGKRIQPCAILLTNLVEALVPSPKVATFEVYDKS